MTVKESLLKKVVIDGEKTEKPAIINYIKRNQLHIVHSGPKPEGNGRYSNDSVRYIAEKEINLLDSKIGKHNNKPKGVNRGK